MAEFLHGHTYAIGLGADFARIGTATAAAFGPAGYTTLDQYRRIGLQVAGWSPVVVYESRKSPVQNPADRSVPFIAIAGRSGPDAHGAIGDAALAAFGAPRWYLDLGGVSGDVARQLVEDPAPDSPTWDAVQTRSGVTVEDVRQRTAWGSWIGFGLGIGGAVVLARKTKHPVIWGVVGGVVGGLVGSAFGGVAAYQLGELPEGAP